MLETGKMGVLTCIFMVALGGVYADKPYKPFVGGNNTCYIAVHWAAKGDVGKLLHDGMGFPDRKQMEEVMPGASVDYDQVHPVFLSFCNGTDIHDEMTKIPVPEQEEIMFIIPVVYGGKYYSFIPTLFLNSWPGVIGGLFFGLRKHHKDMAINQVFNGSSTQETIHIADLLDVKWQSNGVSTTLPKFVEKTFSGGTFITKSYVNTIDCYSSRVNVSFVHAATGDLNLDWESIKVAGKVDSAVRLQYSFTMNAPHGCGGGVDAGTVVV